MIQPKDFWKDELRDFSSKNGNEMSRNEESGPMLLDVLEGYLKYEVQHCTPYCFSSFIMRVVIETWKLVNCLFLWYM